jgi:hypothetical protein
MLQVFRSRLSFHAAVVAILAVTIGSHSAAAADVIPANADAFQTLPGSAGITLPGIGLIPLEGATEFSTPTIPLTAAEVARLNSLAPNLNLVSYQLEWVDPHGNVVGPTSAHKVSQELVPVVNTTPNFDTVIQRLDPLTFTAGGQTQETQIRILMLDLQSVSPVLIGGFHYEGLVRLANGSPVYDPADLAAPQYLGNVKFDSTLLDPNGVHGTLDLGVTGPTPTAANLGADLPSGMEGLPVNFDIQFIPLDGGPAIPTQNGEVIFQNNGASSFAPNIPEPGSGILLATALGLGAGLWRRHR